MEKMKITSDVSRKLKKIFSGNVFDDPLVFVTEFLQNSQRARAKNVYISTGYNWICFRDDGCGAKNPESVLTLDFSDWESTDEGFGMGFYSFLAVPAIEACEIMTRNWVAALDVEKLFENGEPEAIVEKLNGRIKGFQVTLHSPYFEDHSDQLRSKIYEVAELMEFDVYLDGEMIPKKNLFEEVYGDFCKDYNNKFFKARFTIGESWDCPTAYYEKRFVECLYHIPYVRGVIELKPKAVRLKEPDRKSIVRDTDFFDLVSAANDCVKDLYKSLLQEQDSDSSLVDKYAENIAKVLDVSEYEKYMYISDIEDTYEDEERNLGQKPVETALDRLKSYVEEKKHEAQVSLFEHEMREDNREVISTLLNQASNDGIAWVATGEVEADCQDFTSEDFTDDSFEAKDKVVVGGLVFRKTEIDRKEFEQEDEEVTVELVKIPKKKRVRKKANIKSQLRKTAKKVWLRAGELMDLADEKAQAEYYGVKVFVAKNILYENVFINNGIAHLSQLKDGVTKRYIKEKVGLFTKKEEEFISLLQPVCQYFRLPSNTFTIGNLRLYIETKLDDRVVDRKIVDNRSEKVGVYAVCEDGRIIFDRKALALKRFNFGDGLGKHEYRALLATLKITAHELAHLLYGTKDNTDEHKDCENSVYEELVNLYLAM